MSDQDELKPISAQIYTKTQRQIKALGAGVSQVGVIARLVEWLSKQDQEVKDAVILGRDPNPVVARLWIESELKKAAPNVVGGLKAVRKGVDELDRQVLLALRQLESK